MGVMVRWRAFTIAVGLSCALAACHSVDRRNIVRLEVFEDHVAVNGVPSDLTIQQAVVDARSRKLYVLYIPRQPLSATRLEELLRSIGESYPEIGIRRVQFSCSAGKPVAISTSSTAIAAAKEAWKSIYGKASQRSEFSPESIANSEPYEATLENGVWHVVGTLPKGTVHRQHRAVTSRWETETAWAAASHFRAVR
jgi:hypothetical protein